jgi:type I restriction enzyme M protein
VLETTNAASLAEQAERRKAGLNPAPFVERITGKNVWNVSLLDLKKLAGDADH